MANGLLPNPRKRNRNFFQQLAQPEEDEGFFGLGRYQPLSEFETPGQQPLIRAPRMRQPELRAPAPIDYQPSPSGYESLVRAPRLQGPEPTLESYGEQYRRGHEKPELAPAPGLSKKRRIGAAIAAFAAEFGRPGAGYRVGQQILYGPREREEREHERGLEAWQEGLAEARERDIGAGRQASERRAQEVHGRYESPEEVQSRRAQEAEAQGLTGEAAQRYILTGKVAQPRDGRPERYTRTRPGGESELLERRPGEEYYRPAEMLAPGVEEIAPPITLERGGVGRQPLHLPGPRPPTEAIVSQPRPTRPSARDVSTEQQRVVARLAREAMRNAGNDTAKAIQDVNDSVDQGMLDPALLDDLIRMIMLQARGRTRRGSVEDEVADALQGIVQE